MIALLLGLGAACPPPAAQGGGDGGARAGDGGARPPVFLNGTRLRGWEEIRRGAAVRFDRRPAAWLFLLPGPLLLAGHALLRPRGRLRRGGRLFGVLLLGLLLLTPAGQRGGLPAQTSADPAAQAAELLEQAARWCAEAESACRRADIPQAIRLYRRVEEILPGSAALQMNLGLLHRSAGRTAEAVHHLRRGLLLDPMDREARRLLREQEQAAGLTGQIPAGAPLPPSAPYLAFLALSNLTAGAALLARLRRTPGALALALLLALLSALALGGFLGLRVVESRPLGVASAGAFLSRIPETGAAERLPLPPGTSLRIRGGIRGWWLVETGPGLRGWIRREQLQVDDPSSL